MPNKNCQRRCLASNLSAPATPSRCPIDEQDVVLIDCDSCTVRGAACGDCVITVLLGSPPAGVELDPTEQAAISVLAEHGLVPPLRLVTGGSESSVAAAS